jgi:hypothetical protein
VNPYEPVDSEKTAFQIGERCEAVLALHGEMQDAKAHQVSPSGASQRQAAGRKHMLTAQRCKARTQRHMPATFPRTAAPGRARHAAFKGESPRQHASIGPW